MMDARNLKKDGYEQMVDTGMDDFRKYLAEKLGSSAPTPEQQAAINNTKRIGGDLSQMASSAGDSLGNATPIGMVGSLANRGMGGMVRAAEMIPKGEFGNIAQRISQQAAPVISEAEKYLPMAQKAFDSAKNPQEKMMFQGIIDKLMNSQK